MPAIANPPCPLQSDDSDIHHTAGKLDMACLAEDTVAAGSCMPAAQPSEDVVTTDETAGMQSSALYTSGILDDPAAPSRSQVRVPAATAFSSYEQAAFLTCSVPHDLESSIVPTGKRGERHSGRDDGIGSRFNQWLGMPGQEPD
eukprot:jgi/Ulvmu1/1763/UM118_0002.1